MEPTTVSPFEVIREVISLPWGLVLGLLMAAVLFWRGIRRVRAYKNQDEKDTWIGVGYLVFGSMLAAGPNTVMANVWGVIHLAIFFGFVGSVIWLLHWWVEGHPLKSEKWKVLGIGLVVVDAADHFHDIFTGHVVVHTEGPENDPRRIPLAQFRLRGSRVDEEDSV